MLQQRQQQQQQQQQQQSIMAMQRLDWKPYQPTLALALVLELLALVPCQRTLPRLSSSRRALLPLAKPPLAQPPPPPLLLLLLLLPAPTSGSGGRPAQPLSARAQRQTLLPLLLLLQRLQRTLSLPPCAFWGWRPSTWARPARACCSPLQ
jgi:hypothetical protein